MTETRDNGSQTNDEQVEAATAETTEAGAEETEGVDRETILRQLEEKTQEAQQYYERMLRLAAEVENLKKRQERERTELVQFANESLIRELLPVVDNLELALEHSRQQDAPPAMVEGVEMVLRGFLQALAKFGVSQINALGEKFDPAYHNAVMQQEDSEAEDQTIIQELQKGYLLQNRLLRPTMVVVARNTSGTATQANVNK
ncbi:MAG: nucleotide exchange factor GrpE [Deltaproteobacteria bacterium]|nr:nucleotide exchange factor GrpE [Deltaproteobacteria bacterium]MBW1952427.1 nucleotide exchange factor GrpE [Deltaproteobacteria bacterium]MBW1986671.1 nucleotide exchange factor GrpE [Deltaproteobacteria bacterium]MBW2134879.1 nucleotide exchange factor GrpE [Deltaproteobacteria bacterium]